MSASLRVGVIGIGIMGTSHARQLSGNQHCVVVALADQLSGRAEGLARELGAAAYGDYREMLARESLDVVVVATPDPFHRGPVEAAAAAGVRNILCEKPLATTVEDAEAMLVAVRRAGSRIVTNFINRTFPLDIATRYFIQSGLLGQPVCGDARVDDNMSVPTTMWGERSRQWASGSSSAHFLLSHVSDLLRWYFSPAEVEGVYAISQRCILGYTPDLYDGYFFFDNGLKVRVKAEWVKEIDELVTFDFAATGTEGCLIYNKLPGFGGLQGLRLNLNGARDVEALAAHQEALRQKGIRARVISRVSRPDVGEGTRYGFELYAADQKQAHKNMVAYAMDAFTEGREVPSSWEGNGSLPWDDEGLKATKIVCALMESAEKRREVAIG